MRRLGQSLLAVVGLTLLTALLLVTSALELSDPIVAVLALLLTVGLVVVGRLRPGPALRLMALVGLIATFVPSVREDNTPWLAAGAVLMVCAGLIGEPLDNRLVPRVRVAQLPGLPDDRRPQTLGPMGSVVQIGIVLFACLLLVTSFVDLPDWTDSIVLLIVLGVLTRSGLQLRTAVLARRSKTVNRSVTDALVDYAPAFYIYFSGPVDGDYQVRMWLPYLEQLNLPYAVLARDPKMLARAAALTDRPVVACQRLGSMDDVMVPSVRALFYVNTHAQCVDGVRYLDRTHVHLNHGDSDKPSSYHPMIGMFDQIFVAGQAGVDRFRRHGVIVPEEKFRLIGRPQVADVLDHNIDPCPDRRTVLYAPTWRGGVQDMSFSSLAYGETIVRHLLDLGVRVMFRPHPLSLKEKESAATIARIDELLSTAASAAVPHVTSQRMLHGSIADSFNASDALVTDVSSVASDYLHSGKPFAVVDVGATGSGQSVDQEAYPVLQAAYVIDVEGDMSAPLRTMLEEDPLAATRSELRTYYLGDHPDEVSAFVDAAAAAIRGTSPTTP
ncbi:MAG TPA: CDP-glycerol glycerophosphotransferase family protein [Flexivirga sp.]|uniref:CDP-glycerol glycerophosphotransferase family protein n=1 Tax=Flexivirga sp. TaxID=1962927 RepID=UPI002B557BB7|nr:CDP-glycerol glycerophosphotransferase family protein [Flexivirga sp.]HWC21973.1 CDP-glycerol glycerophosphotransferase family protein [Flexivirga sp.]